MQRGELERKSIGELLELAVKYKVPVRDNMDKAELVDAIHETLSVKPVKAKSPEKEKGFEEEAVEKEAEKELKLEAEAPGMQQAVEESRYFTGQPEPPMFGIPAELPHHYNDNQIAVLVRDPHWIYSYWEVTPRRLDAARAELGGGDDAQLALRVYDITDKIFDGANANEFYDIGVYDSVGDWYINTGRPDRSFVVDLGLKAPDGRFITLARSNVIRPPRDTVSDVLDEEWVIAEEQYQRIFALSGGYSAGMSSAGLAVAGARRIPFGVASPGMGSLALMSPSMRKKERGFWFVLNAELIVYGATEPDADVTIQGRPIQIRPDGTFTLRFALPDGKQVIPVSFTSADKAETGWIIPEVTRDTKTN